MKHSRLLIVDSPGGPLPSTYLPMLPKDIDIYIIQLQPTDPQKAQKRLQALQVYADVHVVAAQDQLKDEIEKIALLWKVDGILAFSEQVVHNVGAVARKLHLPSNSERTQDALQNKELQRSLLLQGGVATPVNYRIECREDLVPASKHVGFPAVLKPVIGKGSISTYEINSLNELQRMFEIALSIYPYDASAQDRLPPFLLEEKWIGQRWHADKRFGDYVSVESLVGDNIIRHVTVTDKLPLAYPFRETGGITPSILPQELVLSLYDEAERAIRALDIQVGAVHTEIKLTAAGPRIIEVNGRVGGSTTEKLSYAANFNIVAQIAELALGKAPREELPVFTQYCGVFTPQPPAADVTLIKSVDAVDLLQLPGVREAVMLCSVGSKPDWRIGTASRVARVTAVQPDQEALMVLATEMVDLKFFEFEEIHPADLFLSYYPCSAQKKR